MAGKILLQISLTFQVRVTVILSVPSVPSNVGLSWRLGPGLASYTELVFWSGEEEEGTSTSTSRVDKSQVQLWWPNGAGDQPLYDLEVAVMSQDFQTTLDSLAKKVAFRTVELVQEPLAQVKI